MGEIRFEVELLGRRWLSDKTFEIQLSKPPSFTFIPGQRIRIFYGDLERDYSLVSTPGDSAMILCVRRVAEGAVSSCLASAEKGSSVQVAGPHGYFVFHPSPRQAIFVATGTGIAPFVSMGRSGVRRFMLLHGVKQEGDLYYRELLAEISDRYVPCLSRVPEPSPMLPNFFHGRVSEYLARVFQRGVYDFYLCGRREMIRDVTLLVDEHFPDSFVFAEAFH